MQNLEFPAVTICNLNPIRKKHLPESLREYFKYSLGTYMITTTATSTTTAITTATSTTTAITTTATSTTTAITTTATSTTTAITTTAITTAAASLEKRYPITRQYKLQYFEINADRRIFAILKLRGDWVELLSKQDFSGLVIVDNVPGMAPSTSLSNSSLETLGGVLNGSSVDSLLTKAPFLSNTTVTHFKKLMHGTLPSLVNSFVDTLGGALNDSLSSVVDGVLPEKEKDGGKRKDGERPAPEELCESARRRKYLYWRIAETPTEDLIQSGHQFLDMVQECSFAGVSCLGYNWTQFWNHLYGNCFVFNTAMIGSNRERNNISYTSSIPGPSDGLLLRLRIEGEEYLGNFSTVSGVRVHISDRHEMPFPGDKGFSVSPGFETSVGMRKVFIHREDPFGNNSCISDVGKPVVRPDYYMENFGVNYSTINISSQDLKSYSGNEEQISANLLSLRIFFEEHNYETIEQRKSYELIDFLSDIGGQMGMFVGLSILTCAELIELLALIIMHLFNRDHKRGAVGADTVTPVIELKKKPLVELPRVQ
ncbi:predicted protein [Nematostella vectensis]|uniref:Uncharacterized protein n=1 Tax=Nematostella vectensis TaxID=45351 RepID=A7SF69_NEMVE|nr:predicted protein [Nematostella vectensis]|eukprot:XP_001629718.1 predicted protein [Nematostella vectensis]